MEGTIPARRICMTKSNYHLHAMKEIPRKERPIVKVTRIDRGPPAALVYLFSLLVTKLCWHCVAGIAWYVEKLHEAQSFFVC
jgi:hypothetical protein